MQLNVGKPERVIRVIVGLVIIGAGVYYQSWWGAIGLVPVFTGILGWCPPYQLLGISTNKK
jgi:predicted transporter